MLSRVGIFFESDWFCPHGCLNRKVAQDDVSHLAEPLPANESYGSVRARLPLHHGVADPSVLRPSFSIPMTCCAAIRAAYSSASPVVTQNVQKSSTPTSQGIDLHV